jgi:hypothetical protein
LIPNLDQYVITIPASTISTIPASTISAIPASTISTIPAVQNVISVNCTYKPINNTAAYINASYYDFSSQSSNLTFVLGIMSDGKTFVPFEISGTNDQVSNPIGMVNDSFIITNYVGKTYTVRIDAQSKTYGTVSENVNVTFPGSVFLDWLRILQFWRW